MTESRISDKSINREAVIENLVSKDIFIMNLPLLESLEENKINGVK